MERDEADFGIFTAEEAILTLKFDTQQQLVVIAEIRESQRENGNKLQVYSQGFNDKFVKISTLY
jgi:hypothetical protein